jgi:hypothetical protein
MGTKAVFPQAAKEGPGEDQYQKKVRHAERQVVHRLQRRLLGQWTRGQGRKVVRTQQVGLYIAGNRVADVVDQVVEEADDQGGEDL